MEKLPHKLPSDMKKTLSSSKVVNTAWDDISPIAKNEWICWVTSAKQQITREKRKNRMKEDLLKGKKRPCCWPGCSHRKKK